MKQTIFNASLEESMNLVTDKYIKQSIDDANRKRYDTKILGLSATLILNAGMLIGIHFLSAYVLGEIGFVATLLNSFALILQIWGTITYLKATKHIERNRVLNYYQFNSTILLGLSLLYLYAYEFFLLTCFHYSADWLLFVLHVLLFIGLIAYLLYRTKQAILKSLYHKETYRTTVSDTADRFVIIAKRYGWLIMLVLYIWKIFFPSSPEVADNDRYLAAIMYPLIVLAIVPIIFGLGKPHIQGYYLKKYREGLSVSEQ